MDKLIIAGENDANQYYATGLAGMSPFITLCRGKKRYLAGGGFEYPQLARVHPTIRFEDLGKTKQEIIKNFLKKYNVKKPFMPNNTPASVFRYIKEAQLTGDLFPEREIKTNKEIAALKEAQKANEIAMITVRDMLAQSKAVNGKIKYKGNWLTSETLKRVTGHVLINNDCSMTHGMIISSGAQTALPHDMGSGVLREGAIIVDSFPRSDRTYYFADCTRTYIVGKAPKHFDERYDAVLKVQTEAIRKIKHGVKGLEKWSHERFKELGFKTDFAKGTGYIHSLGHGVGLDLHENPRFSSALKAGNVVTVEPGLYYDYGIRIEDIGLVTKTGFTNFSKIAKNPYL